MRMHSTYVSAFTGLALTLTSMTAVAGHEVAGKILTSEWSPFDKGGLELQIGATAYHSSNANDERPESTDVGGTIRLGWMLSDVAGSGWLRGNWELLVEGHASGITQGPGDVLAGGGLILRYNFVCEDGAWVPYLQLGVGGVYSDAHEDRNQRLIGSEWSFLLQGGLGVRYFFTENTALFLEANYRHISNADTADRNTGLNSVGAVLGVSWFF